MEGYLGETVLHDLGETPFKDFTEKDWALYYIGSHGQTDGAHHKLWVLDQVARILNGAPIEVKVAKWSNGHSEYRVNVLEPTTQYYEWVKEMRGEYDPEEDEYEYSYDEGICP